MIVSQRKHKIAIIALAVSIILACGLAIMDPSMPAYVPIIPMVAYAIGLPVCVRAEQKKV